MRIFRFIKSNLIPLIFLLAVTFSLLNIYFLQEDRFSKLEESRLEVEKELISAKEAYERIFDLEKIVNTSSSKETQIRERLNMIKKDEIQFLFSKINK